MRVKSHVRLVLVLLCLFAALAKAEEFVCGFSSSEVFAASMPIPVFAIGDNLLLEGADGVSFAFEIVAAPPAGIAGQSFIANDLQSRASAVVKPTKDGVHITVDDFEHQKIYSICVQNGIVETAVHDTSGSGDDVCGTCGGDLASPPQEPTPGVTSAVPSAATRTPRRKSAMLGTTDAFPLAEQRAVVDVLVAFDQGAVLRSAVLGYDTITNFADYAVAKMNTVLEKSRLDDKFFYRLVGVIEVDATYDVINNNLLEALRQRNSGPLAPVGAARERCGADTITLLIDRDRNKSSTSGLGYEYKTQWTAESFDANGYTCNICDIKTVYERYTMSHEQGHNLGCGHSERQGGNSGPGRYSYSCGYHFVDAAGTNRYTIMAYDHTDPASGTYYPVPYFASPEITPAEIGMPVGTPTNDNRQTILQTYNDVSAWREHVVPYEWDVRFIDDNGNDIPDGTYFVNTLYVTLTNDNPAATIYYTFDGSTPGPGSYSCPNGQRFPLYESKKITACAVTNGVAMSVRTVAFNAGRFWSGEAGQNGSGAWADDDAVLSWDNPPHAYDTWTPVVFADIPSCSAATVSVCGAVAPYGSAFPAIDTTYTFEKGTADALVRLRDACFAPSGDLTFNVPVQFDAVAFTNPASHTLAFNAPFGQIVTETSGYCTNMIGIGGNGRLVVSPGAGKTQTFDKLDTDWFYSSARFCVGEGTVVFKGPSDPDKGLVANTGISVDRQGCLVFDTTGKIAGIYSSLSGDGTVVCKAVVSASSLKLTDSAWKGTLVFENLVVDSTTQNFQFELYGNVNSRILLRNCAISYLNGNNATFLGTLVLEKDAADHAAFTTVNGSSEKYNVFGALEGDGAMSFATGQRQGYVFNVATNFTGNISVDAQNNYGVVGGRYIVFGQVASSSDLPSQSATITVKSGAMASIGGEATWYAYHGVDVGGTLLVKGANATLDCQTSEAMGLKLGDGATLRFDAPDAKLTFAKTPQFAVGTVNIAFAAGVAPTNGMVLVQWPDDATPSGDFAFADSAFSERFLLNKTATGLVVEKAPLPAAVNTSISVRYWGDDGWEDRPLTFDLPTGWATNYYPSLDTPETVAAKYNEIAANGATVWQCYMLGLDPTNEASQVSLAMTVAGNEIRFAVEGLGETHALDGIKVEWRMKTSTNLVADAAFSNTREYKTGLLPAFGTHSIPDTPVDPNDAPSTKPAAALFYKITVSFVAEDNESENP